MDRVATQKLEKPFFAYIASNTPHAPYIARSEDKALYEGKGLGQETESFFGMIHNIDQNVGKILANLDEWEIAKDTLVIFMNDNGGTAGGQGVQCWNARCEGHAMVRWYASQFFLAMVRYDQSGRLLGADSPHRLLSNTG